ncbi:hypothetical protein [Brevibacillus nitrificans]|nr:hypothetical protein [Brevibacillus nitrificans]
MKKRMRKNNGTKMKKNTDNTKNVTWWNIGTFLMTTARTLLAFITYYSND